MDAWQARQALLESQPDQGEEQADILSQSEETEQVKKSRVSRLLLIILALGLLGGFVGGLIWLGWRWLERGQSPSELIADSNSPCCLTEVPKVPTGDLTYITDSQGTWRYVLNGHQLASYDKTLEKELKERDPRLSNYTLRISSNNVIDELRAGKASFALTTWRDLPPDWGLEQEKIAYDGLVVFVVFRDAQTRGSLPKALNGKISIDQLRALYTGEEKYLELSDNSKIPVKLNMPVLDDPKAVELFKQMIFKGNPEQAQKFEEVKKDIVAREVRERQASNYKNSYNRMLDNMFKDFDNDKTIEIGFGFLSKIFGQCSVYPLTVVEGGREAHPLIQNDGNPIEPTIDLCNDKGSYSPNAKAFKSEQYPLTETLVVVYPKKDSLAGKSFAALLTTDEAQYLLSEVGLVPNNRYNDPSK
jgi:flagellar basal body-associated protein FliL